MIAIREARYSGSRLFAHILGNYDMYAIPSLLRLRRKVEALFRKGIDPTIQGTFLNSEGKAVVVEVNSMKVILVAVMP